MTPEQIAVINTVALILERVGTWPVGSLVAMLVVGPWVAILFISWGHARRYETMRQMYEANVELVKRYNAHANNLQDLVILVTQTMTAVKELIENNLYCPVVRKQAKQKEVDA